MTELFPSTSVGLYALLDDLSKLMQSLRSEGKFDEAASVFEQYWGIRTVAYRTKIVEDLASLSLQVKADAWERAEREKGVDEFLALSIPRPNDERAVLIDNHGKVMKP